ncbi:hypothetical protein EFK07_09305 [Pseudomonas putida]|uniref:Uncharacterized protein n=1 Tax=Pseudomonas putida TaxID=303 RepID=A0A3M8TCC1_PSEPU|nr:hypothetical protein EFK07_09305 [Pseudomonas putida]
MPVPASSRVNPLPQGYHCPVGAGLPAKRPVLAIYESQAQERRPKGRLLLHQPAPYFSTKARSIR